MIFKSVQKILNSFEVNSLPLSDIIVPGTPKQETKLDFRAVTTDSAVLSIKAQETKNPVPLSRIVKIYLKQSAETGRGPIKSI